MLSFILDSLWSFNYEYFLFIKVMYARDYFLKLLYLFFV